MKLLIFDLDFTLVNTTKCQDYLKTRAGREAILDKLDSGEVVTELYFPDIVDYVNSLIERFIDGESDTLPIVLSNSPQLYCEKIVKIHGFKIQSDFIYGNAHKPCVDWEALIKDINHKVVKERGVSDFLVVGDSPRDVFFGHESESPSVWAKWGYNDEDHMFDFDTCKPTRIASNLNELKGYVEEYIAGGEAAFDYEKPNFQEDWDIQTIDLDNYQVHTVEAIGYAREYVPEFHEFDNPHYTANFFEVNWMLKPAKDVPESDLWKKVPQRFYKQGGGFAEAQHLIKKAGVYKFFFKRWLETQNVTGKVLLVPVPSSVPAECNKTHTVKLIATWWEQWLNKEKDIDFELIHKDLLIERFQPKMPTHAQKGKRCIEEQLKTMGLFRGVLGLLPNDISAVVFLDDVTTSGQSINAMATIFRELKVVPEHVPLYGYVWFKTHHPEPDFDFDKLIELADNVAAEN
ncbi:hypothetical protein R7Z44_14495 [Vibrio sp. 1409]|uniref:HAD family hydrolase n=1 Tax=Vibrio sp. 1409 TaxID=3074558 RepID=UPI001CF1B303|nr:hypothetical protein [Vibrio alginolyticus]MDW2258887.1 hypothetical protein [Vibrio sp. 1409]